MATAEGSDDGNDDDAADEDDNENSMRAPTLHRQPHDNAIDLAPALLVQVTRLDKLLVWSLVGS